MDVLTEASGTRGPQDRPDEHESLAPWLIALLQDDWDWLADRERMRERAAKTIDRVLRAIAAGGAMALRPEDLRDVEADIGALLASGESIGSDLVQTLLALRRRVEALLAVRDQKLEAVDKAALAAELDNTRNARSQQGGLGGA